MQGSLRHALSPGDRRLVGHQPVLQTAEYQRESWQLYSRLTMIATDERNATAASASISVERRLVRLLRQGDIIHITSTASGGIGLSVFRDDQLVAAAGAIASVPLGSDVSACFPQHLIQQAEAIFHRRDPEYHLRESPIELTAAGETRILDCGRRTMGAYDVFVRHGFIWGIPGTDACVSIERRGVCPETAAHTSAQLLKEGGLDIVKASGS